MWSVKYKGFYIHGTFNSDRVEIQNEDRTIYCQEHASREAAERWIRRHTK